MARYLVVADLHASQPSVQAIGQHGGEHDGLISLGDIVGYGPHPNEAVAFVMENAAYAVMGNHDQACFDDNLLWWFNGPAKQALMYSRRKLLPGHMDWLRTQPYQAGFGPFVFAHSNLNELWAYVKNEEDAISNLTLVKQYRRRILFVGHTHISEAFRIHNNRLIRKWLDDGDTVDLSGEDQILINPGSAGQPRDGDTRLAFGILDDAAMTYTQRRVTWDVAGLQEDMRKARLPDYLINRLSEGK